MEVSSLFKSYRKPANPWYLYVANTPSHLSVSERFSDLLSKNPDIACYMTDLNHKTWSRISDHELHILDMLKEHSSLQSIELSSSELDWEPIYLDQYDLPCYP